MSSLTVLFYKQLSAATPSNVPASVAVAVEGIWSCSPEIETIWTCAVEATRLGSTQMHNQYETVRVKGTFTNSTSALVDPTTIVLAIRPPTGVVTTFSGSTTVTNPSTGIYQYDYSPSSEGTHEYWWKGIGTNVTVIEASEFVAHYTPDELS